MSEENQVKSNQQILTDIEAAFIPYQNFNYAIIGGLGVSLLCAILWASFTVITEYQIGFIAILIGIIIGFSIRFFGAGLDIKYAFLGGSLALLSCLLGNLFAQIGFIAKMEGLGYFEAFRFLDFTIIKEIMLESFSPMDLFFYAIAAYEGFKFSVRVPSNDDLEDHYQNRFSGKPFLDSLRAPLAIGSFLILAVIWFLLSGEVSGEKEFHFEDGSISAKGNYIDGQQDGLWNYFHNNGKTQASGLFLNGLETGTWEFYDTVGQIIKTIAYTNGMMHGNYMTFENGSIQDSGMFVNNREEGRWISRYPNGQLMSEGMLERGRSEGIWKQYYENGQLNTQGLNNEGLAESTWLTWDEQGKLIEEVEYEKGELNKIIYANEDGKDVIINGNGDYKYKDLEGNIYSSGSIKNGKKNGIWKSFYPNGNLHYEFLYDNDDEKIINVFESIGMPQVKDGNGMLKSVYESNNLKEEGEVKNGKRQGNWITYYDSPGAIASKLTYNDGKLEGPISSYNLDQSSIIEGEYKNDQRTGLWKWYFTNGMLESQVNYNSNNQKEGRQIFFNESGIEVKEEIYENGELMEENILNANE